MRKIFPTLSVSALLLAALSSCASRQIATLGVQAPTESAAPSLTFIFASNRYGIMEPCGCSLQPLGGLHREWNLNQDVIKLRPNAIRVSAGTTFPSWNKPMNKTEITFVRDRGTSLVKALGLMQLDVLSPSAEDFKLGIESLSKLQSESRFPWVSSNLYLKTGNKPVFKPMHSINRNGIDVVFLGLSSKSGLPRSAGIIVKPAAAVLPALLAKIPRNAFVVLLSSLTDRERLLVTKNFPRINLILGGDANSAETGDVVLKSATTAYFQSERQARKIGVINVDYALPFTAFFSGAASASQLEARGIWSAALARQNISTKERNRLRALMKESESIPLRYSPGMSSIAAETIALDQHYDGPHGPMKSVIDEYYQQARSRALQTTY